MSSSPSLKMKLHVAELVRRRHVARLSNKLDLTEEEKEWIDLQSHLRIPQLEKVCQILDKDLQNGVITAGDAVATRRLTILHALIAMKRRPNWKRKNLQKNNADNDIKGISIVVPFLIHSGIIKPQSFCDPECNYGIILDQLEKIDPNALPCKKFCSQFPAICNRRHVGFALCEELYESWRQFQADYEAISGDRYIVIPDQSICKNMYRSLSDE